MRLQFEITNDRMEQLDALIKKVGFSTRAQFFNTAWSLFDWAVRELEQGRIIASMDEKAGTYKEAVIPGLAGLGRVDTIEVDLDHLGEHLDELKSTLETEEQKESFEELEDLLDKGVKEFLRRPDPAVSTVLTLGAESLRAELKRQKREEGVRGTNEARSGSAAD